jgi:hypothetical protein
MPGNMKKAPAKGSSTTKGSAKPRNLSATPPAKRTNRSMSALDKAIMEGRPLPSKNRRVPADTDVKMKGFKAKPVIRIKKK